LKTPLKFKYLQFLCLQSNNKHIGLSEIQPLMYKILLDLTSWCEKQMSVICCRPCVAEYKCCQKCFGQRNSWK